jgi:hypothetical protein
VSVARQPIDASGATQHQAVRATGARRTARALIADLARGAGAAAGAAVGGVGQDVRAAVRASLRSGRAHALPAGAGGATGASVATPAAVGGAGHGIDALTAAERLAR